MWYFSTIEDGVVVASSTGIGKPYRTAWYTSNFGSSCDSTFVYGRVRSETLFQEWQLIVPANLGRASAFWVLTLRWKVFLVSLRCNLHVWKLSGRPARFDDASKTCRGLSLVMVRAANVGRERIAKIVSCKKGRVWLVSNFQLFHQIFSFDQKISWKWSGEKLEEKRTEFYFSV